MPSNCVTLTVVAEIRYRHIRQAKKSGLIYSDVNCFQNKHLMWTLAGFCAPRLSTNCKKVKLDRLFENVGFSGQVPQTTTYLILYFS